MPAFVLISPLDTCFFFIWSVLLLGWEALHSSHSLHGPSLVLNLQLSLPGVARAQGCPEQVSEPSLG